MSSAMRPLPLPARGFAVLATLAPAPAQAVVADAAPPTEIARGTVFVDRNRDGTHDAGEPGLPGVRVSQGRDIVFTDAAGHYEITLDHDDVLFVIKPRGYMVAVNEHHVPRGHYVHKPKGSPTTLRYAGVSPTGPLPSSIDFPLRPNTEPETFRMLAFGDPQPRDQKEVDYISHDVLNGLDTRGSTVGIALGDIAFDQLETLEPLNAAIGELGMPFFYVYGNHDMNLFVESEELADETWERIYGPTNYAFDWGPVHFVVLDNVEYLPQIENDGRVGRGKYRGHFDDAAMAFLRADLESVPNDQQIVVAFHIHLDGVDNRDEFLAEIAGHPNNLSMSAHTHMHRTLFFDRAQGYPHDEPHVHINHGTLCGSWFRGQKDLRGIPHATMSDGTPNGYGIFEFDPTGHSHRYYAAGAPGTTQMRIMAAPSAEQGDASRVYVNVFAGSARSTVEMRIDDRPFAPIERTERPDPDYRRTWEHEVEVHRLEVEAKGERSVDWIVLPRPRASTHLWTGSLPRDLGPGLHRIRIRSTDMYGQVFSASRTIRIVEPSSRATGTAGRRDR